jgi:hypothetical protein
MILNLQNSIKTTQKARHSGHTCNPSTRETEADGLRVQSQPELHFETLPQKINNAPTMTKQKAHKANLKPRHNLSSFK